MHSMGPPTMADAVYAEPFPSRTALMADLHFRLPVYNTSISLHQATEWTTELSTENYKHLKDIFDSRATPAAIRQAGAAINETGGFRAMQAMFYVYYHFINTRCVEVGLTREQHLEVLSSEAKDIEYEWHGIGDWRA